MDITSWALLFSIILNIVTIASIIVDIVSSNEKKSAIQRIFRVLAMIFVYPLSLLGLVLAALNAESLGLWYPLFISALFSLMVFHGLLLFFRFYLNRLHKIHEGHHKIHEDLLKIIEKIADRLP